MTKTPEQMAEEWASGRWYADHDPTVSGESKVGYLAGYQAAKDQLADAGKVMNSSNNSNGWISVKERLPEMNVVALVFSKLTYLNVAHRVVDDKGWCWATVSMSIAPYEITHWIPLPEPPKEEA